ncbi:MAG: ABC transporter ATP-binding protein [Chloroflexota bacterium]
MLEIVNIAKEYEGAVLLDGLSFHVASAEIVCLLGASGSGKSTILRIIAGLESAEGGEIHWGGEDISLVPAYRRKFGLVFQDYALFPHLTVAENIAFGLRMQDLSRQAIHIRVAELLDLVNLTGFEQRRVTDLSGGEQQRVAMARALAPRPRLLMLDEPLGALDRGLRDHLLDELRAILRAMGIPVIYVTHDQEEAFAIADRILLLRAGQIVRDANPQEVYDRPGSAWVAAFLGLGNILSGQVRADGRIQTKAGLLEVDCPHQHKSGSGVTLLLRPQHVQMAEPNAEHCIQGIVTDVAFSRDGFKVTLDSGVVVTLPKAPGMGEEVTLSYRPSDIGCLPAD